MRKAEIQKDGKRIAEVILADRYFLRLRGLIGRTLRAGEGLLLIPCNQIHTFRMGYAIDVVYLDPFNRVLRIEEAVQPGRSCKAVRGARKVLELPAYAAGEAGLAAGDVLEVIR